MAYEKQKRYHKAHPEIARKIAKSQKILNPNRYKARMAVSHEKRRNPSFQKPCEICQSPKSQAHHYLGYDYQNWLVVKWLCRAHHNEAHCV